MAAMAVFLACASQFAHDLFYRIGHFIIAEDGQYRIFAISYLVDPTEPDQFVGLVLRCMAERLEIGIRLHGYSPPFYLLNADFDEAFTKRSQFRKCCL